MKITTSLGTQYNQATTAVSYNSSSDKRVHFGLGSAGVVDTIELTWPSGIKQVLKNVKADQILTVTESAHRELRPNLMFIFAQDWPTNAAPAPFAHCGGEGR